MANITIYPFGTNGTLPAGYPVINDFITGGADKAFSAEMGKEVGKILGEYKVIESAFTGFTSYKDGYQIKADSTQVGKNIDNVSTYADASCHNIKIPVTGMARAVFRQYTSNYNYGSLVIDESGIVLAGIVSTISGSAEVSVNLPANSAYLVFSYYSGNYDKTITLYTADGLIPAVKELSSKSVSSLLTGMSPSLIVGKIDDGGDVITDGSYVTTEAIFGDFSIELSEGWRVYEGHMYDIGGKLVSYQHIHPEVSHSGARGSWSSRTFMAIGNSVPDYGIRLTLCKSDQSAIAEGEQPIKNLVILSDSGLHRWVPADLPNYDVALRRIDYLQRLRFTPLAKVPDGYPASGQTTNLANTYFFFPGQLAPGVPYSDVAETRTYIPNNVSLRTFMTAVKNKRSLLYTEELATNTSKYGKTYKTGNRRAYYGTVCCGFTAWVMGMDTMYLAGGYGADNVPGLSSVTYTSVDDLRPLDLIWNDGHISIISDIWKDEFGEVKYIVWAEMSTPYCYRTPYTPEQFNQRITDKSATIHRWNGWANLAEPEASEYSQYLLGQTMKEPEWSGDIMCFAGDYAAFVEGDIIYLNARRNSVYTGVELYKNDVLLDTIDITGLSADTIVTPNDEDWVKVNLTTLNLTYGKYKARLTDGTNTTDYTYFEVIDITFSATKVSSSSISVSVSSNSGVPVSIEKVKDNGFPSSPNGSFHAITDEEVEAGTFTLDWSYNSTYKYLMLLVRGDYGTVPKKISFPTE